MILLEALGFLKAGKQPTLLILGAFLHSRGFPTLPSPFGFVWRKVEKAFRQVLKHKVLRNRAGTYIKHIGGQGDLLAEIYPARLIGTSASNRE